jgi:hypothetical protein
MKRSGAAGVEVKQRIQLQKPAHLHLYTYQRQPGMVFDYNTQ